MATKVKTIAIVILVGAIIVMVLVIRSMNARLNDAQNSVANAHEQLTKLSNICTIMQETLWRQDAAISDYIAASHKAQDANVQRIETIDRAEDACDWLDNALPASVGVLFRDACRDTRDNDPATAGAD